MRPRIRAFIQYNSRESRLALALAYRRFPRTTDPKSYDVYGLLLAFCGSGFFSDNSFIEESFHMEERVREGFVSYIPAALGTGWADDRFGISGLADTDFAPGVERILESIYDYMFGRWTCWADEGYPDLQAGAKRRLGCTRRKVSYWTPDFDWALLDFIDSVVEIPFFSKPRSRAKK